MNVRLSIKILKALTMALKMDELIRCFLKHKWKKLNQTEQDNCEGLLTKTECLEALKNMECNKTPGSDGLPGEFH